MRITFMVMSRLDMVLGVLEAMLGDLSYVAVPVWLVVRTKWLSASRAHGKKKRVAVVEKVWCTVPR